jgi:hypothetical protein
MFAGEGFSGEHVMIEFKASHFERVWCMDHDMVA